MRIMGVSIVVACISVVLIVVVEATVAVDSVVVRTVRTEISLERHVVVVVVAGVRSDGGRQMNTGSDE